ncbi:hypothetical protein BG000_005438, partial [Podila horticola]
MGPQEVRTSATEQENVEVQDQVPGEEQNQHMNKDLNTDSSHKEAPISPEVKANILSLWTMWWINGLFRTGYKRQIQEDDLYQLLDQRKAHIIGGLLLSNWEAEKANAKAKNRTPSLLRALVQSFWRRYLPGYICLEIGDSQTQSPPPPASRGYAMAFAIFAIVNTQNFLYQRWNLGSLRTGLYIRTALIDLVFRKATTLSGQAHLLYPDGAIINLMSTDISRIDSAMMPMLIAISAPIYITAVIGLLIRLMGPSALLGAAILMASNPLQAWGVTRLGPVRKKASQFTDQRIRLSTEVLQGVKVIKFFAWEPSFLEKLADIREQELGHVKHILRTRGFVTATAAAVPVFAAALSFVLYAAFGHDLAPDIVFPALAYYATMRVPIAILPNCFSAAVDTYVAIRRIQKYLLSEDDTSTSAAPLDSTASNALLIRDADFVWASVPTEAGPDQPKDAKKPNDTPTDSEESLSTSSETSPYLRDINLQIPRGALVAVVGPVGSGKSSLLQAMVGNMPRSRGTIVRGTTVSYASQTPWIQNASIRDNVLFDTEYDSERYRGVIRSCCLEQDLSAFPAGDLTEIGERGVNLSGGQKARLSLARSVYFNAGTVIMDDPLSAVDAHVGKRIWKQCVLGELKDRTRVIATHQLHVLPDVDVVICMKDGAISEMGSYAELMEKNGEFSELMAQYGGVDQKSDKSAADKSHSRESDESSVFSMGDEIQDTDEKQAPAAHKLMTVEERETGAVSNKVYAEYFKMVGWGLWITVIVLYVVQQVCGAMMNYWLSLWSGKKLDFSMTTNILVYVAFAVAQFIVIAIASQLLAIAVIRTTRKMHSQAFDKVLHAPLLFFDTTPTGRILNRFSKDVDALDNILWMTLNDIFYTLLAVLASVALTLVYFPWLIVAILPMAGAYYFLSLYYRATSRELKRLDATLRSHLFAHFSESLTGMGTLKAYGRAEHAILVNQAKLDLSNRPYYLFQVGSRWIAFRVNVFGSCLVLMAGMFVVGTRFAISAASAGLVLSYLTRTAGDMNWVVQCIATLENNMNSVERLVHYVKNLPQEPPAERPDATPEPSWPSGGAIVFRDVTMRYRPELDPVLKNISFEIQAGHKVGVVGRTGAGKSSLIQALFLLCELDAGQIELDGVDTSSIGTMDLRSHIGIIPQDPVLFYGSFRYNLDPLGRHTEQELWAVLETSDLKSYVQAQEGGLEAMVAAQGENLSVGQRQLVCLSRALLAKSKVVVLDEATASVDMATDALIQKAIRVDFAASTVLT